VRELSVLLDPARSLTIARELTKTFETIVSLPLEDANAWIAGDANRERGEFVLIVDAAPAPGKDLAISAEARRLLAALLEELPPARAARVAAKVTKMPRELLYEHACRASSTRRDDA
jgi:16S rRNA (cytidine1402-2'-O)-methyltransferase